MLVLVALHRWGFRRPAAPCEPLLATPFDALLLLFFWFLAQAAAHTIVGQLLGTQELSADVVFLSSLVVAALVFLVLAAYGRVTGQSWSAFGFRLPHRSALWLPLFLLASWWLVQCVALVWKAMLDRGGYNTEPQQVIFILRDLAADHDVLAVVKFAVASILLAPLIEEIVFRGFFFAALETRFGFALAASISSFIFAVVHLNLLTLAPLALLGFIFCYLYQRTGSLWLPIAYHSLFNGANTILGILGES